MKNKKLVEQLKQEVVYLFAIFIAAIVILKIAFYKESFITIARTAFGIFWLFVLPGFCLLYHWHEKINFIERFIMGIVISAAIIGILSYYIGLMGLNIKYHIILLPLMFLAIDFIIIIRKIKKE